MGVARFRLGELTSAHQYFTQGSPDLPVRSSFCTFAMWLLGHMDQSQRMLANYLARTNRPPFSRAIPLTVSLYLVHCGVDS